MPAAAFSFTILDSVDSTNNYAMQNVHAGMARHGDGYFAKEQTNGKGQRGKSWETDPGSNILKPFHLSVAVAVACYDLFEKFAGEDTSIKWPNDLYWRDRKAGGILIENIHRGKEWNQAIVGIGININQGSFSPEIKNPVSLKHITGKDFDPIALAKELQEQVIKTANQPFFELYTTVICSNGMKKYRSCIKADR
jgi:BirA family biotin operon repressor/biotin-[acetyl-CoA-carboxylase] ligase